MGRPRLLVGDVGGTNSRWAIFDGQLGPVSVYRTEDTHTLQEAASQYLNDVGISVQACCVAVAGPVHAGSARLTNAEWQGHCDDLPVPTRLVNDLEGAAYGVRTLDGADIDWWSEPCDKGGSVLVLGVGTGFGGARIEDGSVFAMEPGHASFCPRDPLLFGGLLRTETTVEELVSGPGLKRIWRFVSELKSDCPVPSSDIGSWVLANMNVEPCASEAARLFRMALVDAVLQLVREHRASRVLLLGGVIDAWADNLFQEKSMEERTLLEGCAVGRVRHPHPALLGAAHLAGSLI